MHKHNQQVLEMGDKLHNRSKVTYTYLQVHLFVAILRLSVLLAYYFELDFTFDDIHISLYSSLGCNPYPGSSAVT